MATQIAILVDGSAQSEQTVAWALCSGAGAYSMVHLVCVQGLPQGRCPDTQLGIEGYLDGLVGRPRSWVRTAVLEGPMPQALSKYIREAGIDQLMMTTQSPDGSKVWLVRVADGRVRRVDTQPQPVMSRPRAA